MRCLICALFIHKVFKTFIHFTLVTLEVCVYYCADHMTQLLSSKHRTVPASADYSGRIIPCPLFVFEAIIQVLGFRHTPNYYITYFIFTCNIDKVIESNSSTQYCNPKIHALANSLYALWLIHARVVDCFRQALVQYDKNFAVFMCACPVEPNVSLLALTARICHILSFACVRCAKASVILIFDHRHNVSNSSIIK